MECPHCKNELSIDVTVLINSDIYNKSNLIVTKCCKNPIWITPIRRYEVSIYTGDRTEDDWGNDIIRKK